MNAIDKIAVGFASVGYRSEAVVRNFEFADVWSTSLDTRNVPIVAFSRTPPSYRSAAMAVVENDGASEIELVRSCRAIGAPLLFVIEREAVTVWQVRSDDPPRVVEKTTLDQIPALFKTYKNQWHPEAIHRAKSIDSYDGVHQLDFVDLGLLPAIEGEIHLKLDRLLSDTLKLLIDTNNVSDTDIRTQYRIVFRMLAAKVLQDRRHAYSENWDYNDLSSVLKAIEQYYSLNAIDFSQNLLALSTFEPAWEHLRSGISFSNISAADLAFVYENTLVTSEARKLFGTHSTPRQVAEYVVQNLELHTLDFNNIRIYEPFAGAGVFLVSAIRHLRDLLPSDWSDARCHRHLIKQISGDEIDPFACEVATLSLILADYPNHNGWRIGELDLFADANLETKLRASNVVVCNPPFEAFKAVEREKYENIDTTASKASVVLEKAIEACPDALGFVLPRSFILEDQFRKHRIQLEKNYSRIEILELPDGIFGVSQVETAAVIARDRRGPNVQEIEIVSTEVSDRDRHAFLKIGETTVQRVQNRRSREPYSGALWIPALNELWDYLKNHQKIEDLFTTSNGLQWNYRQAEAASDRPHTGFLPGYLNVRRLQQFVSPSRKWLDFRPESLRRGMTYSWSEPKIIASATRLSRGPWRFAAFPDFEGSLCSQQFFALRPKARLSDGKLMAISGILNGPIANAFLAINSPRDRFRASMVGQIPLPKIIPVTLVDAVSDYQALVNDPSPLNSEDAVLARALDKVDAEILRAYDLPLRLEKQLIEYFDDAVRPVAHDWQHWSENYLMAGTTLFEAVSEKFANEGDWISKVFKPLPDEEVSLLRKYAG